MKRNGSTVKYFSALTLLTIFEKIIAFVFEATIAAKLGTTIITDAYFAGAELFTIVDATFFSSLTVIVINRYAYYENIGGDKLSFDHVSTLLSMYFPFSIVISILFVLLAKPLSYVAAPGFDVNARNILIRCIRVMSVVPIIGCVTAIALAILRQKREFIITGLKSLFISVVGIIGLVVFGSRNLRNADILSFSYNISMVLFLITTLIIVKKYGKLRIRKPIMNEEIKKSLTMVLPLMISAGITSVALMVDKVIASVLGEGNVSALTYAHSLYKVVITIFVMNMTTIILTDFNNLISKKNYTEVIAKVKRVILLMTELLLPITIISVICSKDITRIIYERGNFSSSSTKLVSDVLLFYSLNFIPAMIQGIYNQVMYAEGDTKTPMIIAMITIIVNVGISISLAYIIGLPGVAIGTFLSTVFSAVISFFAVRKYLKDYINCYSFVYIIKMILASLICIIIILLLKLLELPSIIMFVISTVVGFVSFAGVLVILQEKNFMDITRVMLKRLNKKSV